MEEKEVKLERLKTANNPNGTFGFSVLGGAGTKFPAVVCEIDEGGPADECGKVQVGDRLLVLNGKILDTLTPNELVQMIRSAPSPSYFLLCEDKEIREQVLSLLKKQERRAHVRQQKAAASHQQQQFQIRGASAPKGDEKGKRKKVIEIEPPVNRTGGEGIIVQMIDNRIVGQFEVTNVAGESGAEENTPQHSASASKQMRSSESGNGTSGEVETHSPSRSPVVHSPFHLHSKAQNLATKSLPGDATADAGVSANGGVVGLEPSLCTNISPGSENVSKTEGNSNVGAGDREHSCATGGVAVAIPQFRAAAGANKNRHRGSLSEVVLISELSKPSEQKTTDGGLPESPIVRDTTRDKEVLANIVRTNSQKQRDQSSLAVTLARKLYMLDGYKKSEVASKLSEPSEFGKAVAEEYLKFFDFAGVGLGDALRQFLTSFSLTGESQERERVMQHFSERYHNCNPLSFSSADAVHGLSVATLLLNTDLHTDHGGRKMSMAQFFDNLGYIGVDLPRDILKETYESIKKNPLQWAIDDPESPSETSQGSPGNSEDECEERVYHVTIPGTFVQAVLPGSAPVFKEGFVMKKNIMDAPHKKVPRGKRTWKAYYAYLKGFLLYFAPPQGQGELHLDDTSSAITVTHCLAMRAHDYHKKSSVVRVTTADWHVFLLQATDVTDMQQWIGALNKAAALYSSPPLAAPIGSQAGFHRPTFPLAPTRNNQEQQVESHEVKVKSLDKEAKEHQAKKPTGKHAKHGFLEEWFDHFEFIQFETNRFRIYLASLCSGAATDFNAPLPSGLIPSPSISTLHNPDQASGESDFLEEFHRRGHASHIVETSSNNLDFQKLNRHSPVLSRKPKFQQL